MSEDRLVGENIPRPDPSRLTTQQYDRGQEQQRREMLSLREYLVSEMRRIEEVHGEKFRGLETRFAESKVEGKSALETALRAVTDANDKSEKNFTKQIEANELQTKTITGALRDQLDGIKERVTGGDHERKGAIDNTARLMAVGMFIIALGMAIFAFSNHVGSSAVSIPPPVTIQPNGK